MARVRTAVGCLRLFRLFLCLLPTCRPIAFADDGGGNHLCGCVNHSIWKRLTLKQKPVIKRVEMGV